MTQQSKKRLALVKLTLTKRTIEALQPADKPWIAWDDKLTGFGLKVHPSGIKSFIVNYRTGDGGRRAPNKRVVIGRYGKISAERARRLAHQTLGKVASGGDPAGDRAEARGIPVLGQAVDDYIAVNPNRTAKTDKIYRDSFRRYLSDWLNRPLDTITRRDVEARFNQLNENLDWGSVNRAISLLRSVYRRPCVDLEGLRNPVDLWIAGGGKFHPMRRRKIAPPSEVLPRWRAGIEAVVENKMMLDAIWFGLYTGMRIREVLPLRWERVDREKLYFRVDQTKTGVPLELPITRQLAAVLDRRWAETGNLPAGWVFPSPSGNAKSVHNLGHLYEPITKAGGSKFWYHALRNCFITVAERDLMLPASLTKRLVNHAPPSDVTQGYATDWTIEQLREPAQRIADRIDTLMKGRDGAPPAHKQLAAIGS